MHNAAFQAVGLDAVYVPLAAASFDDFAAFARAFDVRGASITAPFKEDAWRAATTSDDLSARLGAVNTLRASGAGWEARNTDVEGFLAPLAGRDLARQRVAMLGAGGAARAVAEALRGRAARVTLYARRLDAAVAVAAAAAAAAGAWPPAADAWDMLVNTTPVGTAPDGARAADRARRSPWPDAWSTTSSTTRPTRRSCRGRGRSAPRRSAACRCSSPRPPRSSTGGPARCRTPTACTRPHSRAWRRRRLFRPIPYETHDLRRVRRPRQTRQRSCRSARRSSPTC